MTNFVKSLTVEVVGAIIAYFFVLIIGYYWKPSLMETQISLGIVVILIAFITIGFFVFYRVRIHKIPSRVIERVKPSKEGAKIFSCLACGEAFEAFPPDDQHNIGSRQPSTDCIPITYTCVNRHKNTIYWLSTKGVLLS